MHYSGIPGSVPSSCYTCNSAAEDFMDSPLPDPSCPGMVAALYTAKNIWQKLRVGTACRVGHSGDCGSLRRRSCAFRLSWHASGAANQIFQGRIFYKVRLFNAVAWHSPLDASLVCAPDLQESLVLPWLETLVLDASHARQVLCGPKSLRVGFMVAAHPSAPTLPAQASDRHIRCMLVVVQHTVLSHFLSVSTMFQRCSLHRMRANVETGCALCRFREEGKFYNGSPEHTHGIEATRM